jgi:hypothetical protein
MLRLATAIGSSVREKAKAKGKVREKLEILMIRIYIYNLDTESGFRVQ